MRWHIDLKLRLSDSLKQRRQHQRLSQKELATRVASGQSRVAKMEAGDPSVTLDLLIRALLALGATKKTVARTIGTARLPQAA